MDNSKQGLWQMDILPKNPMKLSTQELFLRNLRLAMFLAELNNLQLWGADVGNAYLQALTRENSTLWVALNLKNFKDMS